MEVCHGRGGAHTLAEMLVHPENINSANSELLAVAFSRHVCRNKLQEGAEGLDAGASKGHGDGEGDADGHR